MIETILHSTLLFTFLFLFLIILDTRFFIRKINQLILCVLTFNLIVSISYLIFSLINNSLDLRYLLLMNLRVITITYTTFFFINHTNLFAALSFSKTLSYLLSLTYSQITAYQKIMNDINFAHTSREIKRDKRHLKIFTTHTIWLFFTKSIYNAKESSLAMRSRGFLDG